MDWDWKTVLHRGPQPGPAIAGARGAGIMFQSASSQVLTAAGDGSIHLLHGQDQPCAFCRGKATPSEGAAGIAGVRKRKRNHACGGVCPVCSGRGTIRVHPPVVRCAFCRGRGQSPPRSGLTCWVCKGRGIVPVQGLVKTCPDCRGAGKRRTEILYCRRCGGVGVVGGG